MSVFSYAQHMRDCKFYYLSFKPLYYSLGNITGISQCSLAVEAIAHLQPERSIANLCSTGQGPGT